MHLHILSDVHLEFAGYDPPAVAADVVVLAGDTQPGCDGVAWAARAYAGKLVVYVPGNHEYYGQAYPAHLHALRRAARGTNVHVLDRDALDVDGVRILGCTLWTDFAASGPRRAAMGLAADTMWDYHEIHVGPRQRVATPADTLRWHRAARAWLERELAASSRPTIVVTHHAPSLRSFSPRPDDLPYAPAYASNLETLVTSSGAALWVHGHIHQAHDYRLGDTRVICNPHGYPDQTTIGFDPALVHEV